MADKPSIAGIPADQIVGHLTSLGAIAGTIMGYLPAVAALAAFTWYLVSIYETKTIQGIMSRWRKRRHRRTRQHQRFETWKHRKRRRVT